MEADWQAAYERWAKKNPELAKQWDGIMSGKLPEGWDKDVPVFAADPKGVATREASNKVMNSIAKNLPWLLGGSADLETSNKTKIDGETSFESGNYGGRILRFGVREMGMGGILNGIAVSGLQRLWRNLHGLQRLHARDTAPGLHHGVAGDLCLHP